jgi:3-methyladenine DNA glycosylase/8-oxoguanine DNA glycosylase
MQHRLIAAHGTWCPATRLRDAPPPSAVAALAPAQLMRVGLAPRRAIALRRAAIEVAAGRADLERAPAEAAARRLLRIPDIGPWTVEMLALHGQGRFDVVAAGDLGYVKLVGRVLTGHPKARAEIAEVREFFAPYGAWKGVAGEYLRYAAARGLLTPAPRRPGPAPRPEGTRWSGRAPRRAAA